MQTTSGENLVELIDVLNGIIVTPQKIEQNATVMQDADGNVIEY